MSPREPSGASKSQKAAFSKTLKKLKFFSVFGSRGLPREPQEAREGSQETPKETPKGGPKLGQKVAKKCTQKWAKKTISNLKKIALTVGFGAVFEAMGPSKNAYFEDVFKMAKKLLKMPKNGPKMIPKWFKIAQIA